MITYKFRSYPSKEQESKLLETLEICRETYNFFHDWKMKKFQVGWNCRITKTKEREARIEQSSFKSFTNDSIPIL